MAEQLRIPLPVRPALGRGDFFVAEANALAVAQIDNWRNWSGGKLVLVGPAGSGKTHLAHVWSCETGARIIASEDLPGADIPALAAGAVAVEDVPDIAGQTAAEEALFHLHNLVLAQGHPLLLTADRPPIQWGLGLPDLQSRVMGAELATLSKPDDALLTAVLAKLFADRQIVPAPDVIPYLVRHMRRSFAMARHVVAALDKAALGTARGVTRALARKVLTDLGDPPGDPSQ